MLFKKQDLLSALGNDHPDFETIEDQICDTSRWSTHHSWVFKHQNKFYSTCYSIGSTEIQDERPFEYEPDEIECKEVFLAVIATEQYVTAEYLKALRGNAKLIFPKLS